MNLALGQKVKVLINNVSYVGIVVDSFSAVYPAATLLLDHCVSFIDKNGGWRTSFSPKDRAKPAYWEMIAKQYGADPGFSLFWFWDGYTQLDKVIDKNVAVDTVPSMQVAEKVKVGFHCCRPHCNLWNPDAVANQSDGKYVCYNCR